MVFWDFLQNNPVAEDGGQEGTEMTCDGPPNGSPLNVGDRCMGLITLLFLLLSYV